MNRVRSKVEFSGIPAGTTAVIERDGTQWRVTWELSNRARPLIDWFDDTERAQYLEDLK